MIKIKSDNPELSVAGRNRLAMDKHFSLLGSLVSSEENEVV